MVMRSAGGFGATVRWPWGAEVEFAHATGYDSEGSVSVRHIVDERGCSVMLREPDCGGNGRNSA